MTRKMNQRITARVAAFALAAALVAPQAVVPVASAKTTVPTLSVVQKTITVGKTFILKVNKNATTKIVSTDWDVNDAGDDRIDLLNDKKKSVKIKAESAGKAVVIAKIKYKLGKTVKTKKQKCRVTVKKAATPTAAPTTAPTTAPTAAPTAAPSTTVNPVFNATQTSFDLNFTTPMACSVAKDSSDTTGSIWTTKANQIASVSWQGADTYKLKITKVTLSNDGKKVSVFVDPGKVRNGARFDVTLVGFYPSTSTPSTSPVKYPMTTAVSGLTLAIDDDLNQPVQDSDGHANVVINFNQEVTNAQNFDSVVGGTYENGSGRTAQFVSRVTGQEL